MFPLISIAAGVRMKKSSGQVNYSRHMHPPSICRLLGRNVGESVSCIPEEAETSFVKVLT